MQTDYRRDAIHSPLRHTPQAEGPHQAPSLVPGQLPAHVARQLLLLPVEHAVHQSVSDLPGLSSWLFLGLGL